MLALASKPSARSSNQPSEASSLGRCLGRPGGARCRSRSRVALGGWGFGGLGRGPKEEGRGNRRGFAHSLRPAGDVERTNGCGRRWPKGAGRLNQTLRDPHNEPPSEPVANIQIPAAIRAPGHLRRGPGSAKTSGCVDAPASFLFHFHRRGQRSGHVNSALQRITSQAANVARKRRTGGFSSSR